MKILKPRLGGGIKLVICLSDGYIVLEGYAQYIHGTSNLYKLDHDLNLVWEAKIANGYNAISNVFLDGHILKVYDGSGEAQLDPNSGQISGWIFTK